MTATSPRLTIVSSYFAPHVGGVETMAYEQARRLAARGWDVEVLTSRLRGDPASERRDGFVVRRSRAWNPLERWFNVPIPLVSPLLARAVVRPERCPDVVMVHGHVYLTSVLATLAARRRRVPVVVVQANPFVEYPAPIELVERAADRLIGRPLLRAATRVTAISHHTADYVRRIAPSVQPVVVHCGVDTARFHPSPDTRRGPRWRAVTVRRLVDRNGVDVLIDAWRASGLDATGELLIGGTGPGRAALEQRAAGLANVRFCGFVPDDDLAAFYRDAHVAVIPTRSGEGFGLMAAEALACGTPVIASRDGALAEVVRDGVDGLLVPPADPQALAKALQRLHEDAELLAALRHGATTTDWSWERNVSGIETILRDVMAPGR
jgi:glycosyltransferase involved in cell wall biosynthesis